MLCDKALMGSLQRHPRLFTNTGQLRPRGRPQNHMSMRSYYYFKTNKDYAVKKSKPHPFDLSCN